MTLFSWGRQARAEKNHLDELWADKAKLASLLPPAQRYLIVKAENAEARGNQQWFGAYMGIISTILTFGRKA